MTEKQPVSSHCLFKGCPVEGPEGMVYCPLHADQTQWPRQPEPEASSVATMRAALQEAEKRLEVYEFVGVGHCETAECESCGVELEYLKDRQKPHGPRCEWTAALSAVRAALGERP